MVIGTIPRSSNLTGRLLGNGIDRGLGDQTPVVHLRIAADHGGLIQFGVFLVINPKTCIEDEPRTLSARPFVHMNKTDRRNLNGRSLGRNERADAPMISIFALPIVVDGELVLVIYLPRQAS